MYHTGMDCTTITVCLCYLIMPVACPPPHRTVPPALDTDKLAPLFLERLVNNVFVQGQQVQPLYMHDS